jgi:hypothetical protein
LTAPPERERARLERELLRLQLAAQDVAVDDVELSIIRAIQRELAPYRRALREAGLWRVEPEHSPDYGAEPREVR